MHIKDQASKAGIDATKRITDFLQDQLDSKYTLKTALIVLIAIFVLFQISRIVIQRRQTVSRRE